MASPTGFRGVRRWRGGSRLRLPQQIDQNNGKRRAGNLSGGRIAGTKGGMGEDQETEKFNQDALANFSTSVIR